ncbi:hypothetical protein [Absidia glauca]|uniref:STAS domain-containing protein n=1 Tax=Absidia glauca TaxID=4829 RepID=A0A168SHL7_ABSGL|nr:hypothetical protein [Absidia glauca]
MTTERGEEIFIDYEHTTYKEETELFFKNLPHYTRDYLVALLPIASWIRRYNLMWLMRDLIAGITVGIVVVPQSMAYAKIAMLPPQYGLYTAFVGLCVYCLFATSKDISIGPTAVMSLLVGQTITRVTSESTTITGPEIAVTFSLLTGGIAMFLGLVRLGILVDFIPACSIAGFMTGSAITITIGQWPKLFGIKGINTQDSTYLIFGNFFKHLPGAQLDVAFGLTGLLFLYGIRYGCQYLSKRYPKYSTHLFFFGIMRNGILIIFATLIVFLMNIGKTTSPVSILKDIPAGFQAMAVPRVDTESISAIASSLPSGIIILILEHCAIAKSFGRINNYTTPIAGIFSGCVVVLALYALTPAFYYIPDATLSAVVIHAVADLVSGPSYIKRLAAVSLWELFVFVVTVIVTFFTSVEYGIYASVALSIVILLFRIARPRFWGLGRVPLADNGVADEKTKQQRYLYVPFNHPSLGKLVEPLPSGVLMCRIDESFTYPNSGYISDRIIAYCKEHTRRGGQVLKKGDRAWNDDADPVTEAAREQLPPLHALILDVASVNRLDSSGLQAVVDASTALNRYAGHHVELHFVNIVHPAIRRALIVAGFGTQPVPGDEGQEILPVVPASKDGPQKQAVDEEAASSDDDERKQGPQHIESVDTGSTATLSNPIPIPKDVYPFFHWSADEAVNAAVRSLSVHRVD